MKPGLRAVLLRGYDPSARTIFAAFTTLPSDARKRVIDRTVRALKGFSLWTKLDGLWMFAAADSPAALINWKTPGTFNATAVNTPTFTADQGYTTSGVNGTGTYINTNLPLDTGGINYTQNSAGYGLWSRTSTVQVGQDMGCTVSSGALSCLIIARRSGDFVDSRINQAAASGAITAASTDGSGLFQASRHGSTDLEVYRNGTSIGTAAFASVAPSGGTKYFVGGNNDTGTLTAACPRQYAMAFVSSDMSDTDAANFYTVMLAYMQEVGAA